MDFTAQNLKCQIRSLESQIEKFKSGKAYLDLTDKFEKEIARNNRSHNKEIEKIRKKHKTEISALKKQCRNYNQTLGEKDLTIQKLKETVTDYENEVRLLKKTLKMTSDIDPALQKIIDRQNAIIEKLKEQLKETEESNAIKDEIIKIQKIQIEKDYTNSSKPSSANPNHKKINSRKPSGKKPGGQKGHKGHCRPQPKPDRIEMLTSVPDQVAKNPDDYELLEGQTAKRSVISIQVSRLVTEYQSLVWRNRKTGQLVYSEFPSNCVNEVNYDASVKALLCLLTCHLNVSINKAASFVDDLSDGAIKPSTGMISNLRDEFKRKSKEERNQIWNDLRKGPWMGVDTTFTRIGGKTGYFEICCNNQNVYYTAGEHKGGELVEKSPMYGYDKISLHDGEPVFFRNGSAHQQCIVHLFRYLMGAEQAEPELKWAGQMNSFLHEITQETEKRKDEAARMGIDVSDPSLILFTYEEIQNYISRFEEILDTADKEYPQKPLMYVDGFNTKKRLREQEDSVLYFLEHPWVPWNNNISERCARTIKRKVKQSDGARSLEGAENIAAVYTVLQSARMKGDNVYQTCLKIYEKPIPISQAK